MVFGHVKYLSLILDQDGIGRIQDKKDHMPMPIEGIPSRKCDF